jgi:hypothetical protein
MSVSKKTHLKGAHHILKYLKGPQDYEIFYNCGDENKIHGFIDVDWAKDNDERRSTIDCTCIWQEPNNLVPKKTNYNYCP